MKKVFAWMALTLWSVMTIFAGETAYLFSYFINWHIISLLYAVYYTTYLKFMQNLMYH